MNRRSFLASIPAITIGALMSPRDVVPPIRYDLFTADFTHGRYAGIRSPFNLDDTIYATDTRIIIAHPGRLTGEASGSVPPVHKLCWDQFDKSGWRTLRSPNHIPHNDGANCPTCHGRGVIGDLQECQVCFGVGEEYTDIGHVACVHCCNGWTGTRCPARCHRGDIGYRELIDSAMFCPDYMTRLRTLGDLEYRVTWSALHNPPVTGPLLLIRGPRGLKAMLCSMEDKKRAY